MPASRNKKKLPTSTTAVKLCIKEHSGGYRSIINHPENSLTFYVTSQKVLTPGRDGDRQPYTVLSHTNACDVKFLYADFLCFCSKIQVQHEHSMYSKIWRNVYFESQTIAVGTMIKKFYSFHLESWLLKNNPEFLLPRGHHEQCEKREKQLYPTAS